MILQKKIESDEQLILKYQSYKIYSYITKRIWFILKQSNNIIIFKYDWNIIKFWKS